MTIEIIKKKNDENQEPQIVDECWKMNNWLKGKETIQIKLNLLAKRELFGPIVQTLENIKSVIYKWVFVRKQNKNDEITRYKSQLVA